MNYSTDFHSVPLLPVPCKALVLFPLDFLLSTTLTSFLINSNCTLLQSILTMQWQIPLYEPASHLTADWFCQPQVTWVGLLNFYLSTFFSPVAHILGSSLSLHLCLVRTSLWRSSQTAPVFDHCTVCAYQLAVSWLACLTTTLYSQPICLLRKDRAGWASNDDISVSSKIWKKHFGWKAFENSFT